MGEWQMPPKFQQWTTESHVTQLCVKISLWNLTITKLSPCMSHHYQTGGDNICNLNCRHVIVFHITLCVISTIKHLQSCMKATLQWVDTDILIFFLSYVTWDKLISHQKLWNVPPVRASPLPPRLKTQDLSDFLLEYLFKLKSYVYSKHLKHVHLLFDLQIQLVSSLEMYVCRWCATMKYELASATVWIIYLKTVVFTFRPK